MIFEFILFLKILFFVIFFLNKMLEHEESDEDDYEGYCEYIFLTTIQQE